MVDRIDKLTEEQTAMLPVLRDKWISIGLCTDPADRPTAEEGVREAYKYANIAPPKDIYWVDSPMAGCRKAAELLYETDNPTKAQIRDQLYQAVWGQHDSWLSYYDTFDTFGLVGCEPVRGLVKVAQSAGWWWAFDQAAVISERATVLHRDDEGRLHNAEGPAMMFPDGFGVYAVHGVRIDKEWIENPNTITPEVIDKHENAEISRVLMGLYGEDKYLEHVGAKKVAEDVDQFGQPRVLYRAEVPWSSEPVCMVRVINSTPDLDGSLKPYFLRVPPSVTTPQDGVAWTFGIEPDAYHPQIET